MKSQWVQKKGNSNELPFFRAQNRSRTDTGVTPLAPEASASTYFAIWAQVNLFRHKCKTFDDIIQILILSLPELPHRRRCLTPILI